MKKVIHKLFFAWNFEKEEQWLNEMASKGLVLTYAGFGKYEFEECLPGEYTIRLELLKHKPSHPESESYIRFIEETGAEHVTSFSNWVYFKKKTADGPFELYSDNTSKIKHLNRIIWLLLPISFLNIIIGCNNLYMAITEFSEISDINYFGLINLTLAFFALLGCYKLYKKRKKLKQESDIFE